MIRQIKENIRNIDCLIMDFILIRLWAKNKKTIAANLQWPFLRILNFN